MCIFETPIIPLIEFSEAIGYKCQFVKAKKVILCCLHTQGKGEDSQM